LVLQVQAAMTPGHLVSTELSGPADAQSWEQRELIHRCMNLGVSLSQRAMEFMFSQSESASVQETDVTSMCETYLQIKRDFGNCVLPFRLMAKGCHFIMATETTRGEYAILGRAVSKMAIKGAIESEFNHYIGVEIWQTINMLSGFDMKVVYVSLDSIRIYDGTVCIQFQADIETCMAADQKSAKWQAAEKIAAETKAMEEKVAEESPAYGVAFFAEAAALENLKSAEVTFNRAAITLKQAKDAATEAVEEKHFEWEAHAFRMITRFSREGSRGADGCALEAVCSRQCTRLLCASCAHGSVLDCCVFRVLRVLMAVCSNTV
jgi:hypothetical protein